MSDEKPDPEQPELIDAQKTTLMRPPEGWQIREALNDVIEKIGRGPVTRQPNSTNWWEAFSHGLAQPMHGISWSDKEHEKGFLARCKDVKDFIALESDFLRFDDEGFDKKFKGDPKGKPIVIGTDNRLKSLALRVVAFLQTRAELKAQGFALPENPDLTLAIDAVRVELAKDVRTRSQFMQLLGKEQTQFQLRAAPEDNSPGMKR